MITFQIQSPSPCADRGSNWYWGHLRLGLSPKGERTSVGPWAKLRYTVCTFSHCEKLCKNDL